MMSKEMKQEKNVTITRRDRHNAILRWMFMGSALYNYETGQATSVVWSLAKLLKKIYPNDEEYKEALKIILTTLIRRQLWGTLFLVQP